MSERSYGTAKCAECGKTFTKTSLEQRYCSNSCKGTVVNKLIKNLEVEEMDNEKIFMKIDELGRMISDWRKVDSQEVGELIAEMIIDEAAELVEIAREESAAQKTDTNCGCLCDECDEANFSRYFEMLVSANKLLQAMTSQQKKALVTVIIAGMTNPEFEELQAIIKKFCE